MKIAAIILAAGGSSRFQNEKHKLLMEIRGKPAIRIVTETAISAGFDPVIVVVGAQQENISAAIADLPVRIVHNPDWQDGQSTSVKCGLRALPGEIDSVCPMLGDQPLISSDTLKLLSLNQEIYPNEIIAPTFSGNRGNPVFFPKIFFLDLLEKAVGDSGGREVIREKGARLIPVNDVFVLRDIDTVEDYQQYCVEYPDIPIESAAEKNDDIIQG